ncbi:hypothetical protein F2Q68_00022100 [Brassica cretica]|uniref:Uncharacterized protein n=1 Tax=Brassica cretica TaxID=69181 RepID=A0A8S9G2R9_BRACR|nr:hypothetical protein F2Q68_00022100 [Brassica cretica]
MKQSEVDGDDYDADKHNEMKKGKMKQDEPRKRTAETDRPASSAATRASSPGKHGRVAGRVAGELGRDTGQLARRA